MAQHEPCKVCSKLVLNKSGLCRSCKAEQRLKEKRKKNYNINRADSTIMGYTRKEAK